MPLHSSRSRPRHDGLSRRDALRLGSVAGLVGLTGCAARGDPPEPWTPEPGTWPRDGYDTQNTRHNPHASPPSDPDVLWEVRDSTARFETLAVAEETVFVGGTSIRAYDLDGTLRWKLNRSAETVAVHGGTCYVADLTDGVAAVSPADGSVAWETAVPRTAYGILPTDGRVFVALHDRLVCLDAETGAERWAEWGEGGAGPTGFALDDALYTADVGSVARRKPRGPVRQFRDQPPGVAWEATRDLTFPSAPTVSQQTVFVPNEVLGGAGGVAAFDATDGAHRWSADVGQAAYSPALVDGRVVFGTQPREEDSYELVAVDGASGAVHVREQPGHWVGSVAVADGVVLAAGGDADEEAIGRLSAYTPDGDRQWSVETAGAVDALAAVGDRIYAVARRGGVYAFGDA